MIEKTCTDTTSYAINLTDTGEYCSQWLEVGTTTVEQVGLYPSAMYLMGDFILLLSCFFFLAIYFKNR